MDASLERPRRTHERFDTERTRGVVGIDEVQCAVHGQAAMRKHALRSVEEAQALLRTKRQRGKTEACQHISCRPNGAIIREHLPLADEGKHEMRKGCEVARCSNRALGRDRWDDVEVQEVDEPFDNRGSHSRMSLGEGSRAAYEHGSHHGTLQKRADTTGMGSQEVYLHLRCSLRWNPGVGEGTEPGGDAVDGCIISDDPGNEIHCRLHLLDETIAHNDGRVVDRDSDNFLDREGRSVEYDAHSASLASGSWSAG